jgi:c(7)-type cytochrome triheme protein
MTAATLRRTLAVAAALCAGVALADLPRLPGELSINRSADSPGQVTFRHENHVDAARPACLGCHPGRFSLLGRRGGEPRPAITHAAMEQGKACGGCHGKAAFGFEDCSSCHAK